MRVLRGGDPVSLVAYLAGGGQAEAAPRRAVKRLITVRYSGDA